MTLYAPLFVLSMAVQNPSVETPYERWAAFEAGSSVRIRQTSWATGGRVDVDREYTLALITPAKVVLQERTTTRIDVPTPDAIVRIEIRADLPAAGPSEDAGHEAIDVDGRAVACRISERQETPETRIREWWSAEIPGGLVRREIRPRGSASTSSSMQVVAWNATRLLSN